MAHRREIAPGDGMAGDSHDVEMSLFQSEQAPRKPKWVEDLEDTFNQYKSSQAEWSKQAEEDKDFFYGVHWTAEQVEVLRERRQDPTTINATYQLIDQAVSMLTSDDPAFQATGRENSDRNMAAVVSDLMKWIWQENRARTKFEQVARDFMTEGRGVFYAFIDPNADMGKGDVRIGTLDPKSVFPDPNSTDPLWDDASSIVTRRKMTKERVKQLWPDVDLSRADDADNNLFHGGGRLATQGQQIHEHQIFDPFHKTFEVLERFQKVKKRFHRVFMPELQDEEVLSEEEFEERLQDPAFIIETEGGIDVKTEPETVAELDSLYEQTGGVFHYQHGDVEPDPHTGEMVPGEPVLVPGEERGNRAIPGTTTRLHPATIQELIESGHLAHASFLEDRIRVEGAVGGVPLYEPFILETRFYPVIPAMANHARTPYPVSDVRMVRGIQKALNKTNSLILAHAANVTSQKYIGPRGALDKEEAEDELGRAGVGYLEYNPSNPATRQGGGQPIHPLAPPQLPTALYENTDRLLQFMQQIIGVFSMQQGDPAQSPATYNGTLAMDEYGMRRIRSKMSTLYATLERLGSVCLELAQDVYTEEKVIRLVQPNMSPHEQQINTLEYDDFGFEAGRFNDITVGRYDIMVVAGSTLPSNRWARLQQYLELYDRGIVDDMAVLREGELPGAENILARSGMMQQMQMALEQQADEIEQLQGQVQNWMSNTLQAEKRAEMEKFKRKLKDTEGEMRRAATVYEAQLDAELDKQKHAMRNR